MKVVLKYPGKAAVTVAAGLTPAQADARGAPPPSPSGGRLLDARTLADLLAAAARGEDTSALAAGADPALVAAFLKTARAVTLSDRAPAPPPPPGAPQPAEGRAFDV